MPEDQENFASNLPRQIESFVHALVTIAGGYLLFLGQSLFVVWKPVWRPIFGKSQRTYPSSLLCLIISLFLLGLTDASDLPKNTSYTELFTHIADRISPDLNILKALRDLLPTLIIALLGATLASLFVIKPHRPKLRSIFYDAIAAQFGGLSIVILITFFCALLSEHHNFDRFPMLWQHAKPYLFVLAIIYIGMPMIQLVWSVREVEGDWEDSFPKVLMTVCLYLLSSWAIWQTHIHLPSLKHPPEPTTQSSTQPAPPPTTLPTTLPASPPATSPTTAPPF